MDLSSAFSLLPIHPSDFCLLNMCIQGIVYIDKCMPFGCSIACSTFEKFSSFLHWQKNCNNPNIINYLDDFLFAGSGNILHCAQLAASFQTLCNQFGIPINTDKTQGPTTNLTFLGLGIYTVSQTILITEDKHQELKSCLTLLLESKKVFLKQMQYLFRQSASWWQSLLSSFL